ncbi:MAG TPA: acetoacetate decarboxylase family protein [Solirubrobacteraceae bacterium]
MSAIPYQEYGARETYPPPFYSHGGRFLGLVMNGDAAKIKTLLDTMLNEPAEGKVEYTAIGHRVVLLVGSFDELGSSAPGYVGQGVVGETQMSIWLPLRAKYADGSERICLTAPYVFVDNPMSLLCGREDFGYPKALAQFEPPRWTGAGIQIEVFGGNFGKVARAGWTQILSVTPAGGPAPAAAIANDPIAVAEELVARATGTSDSATLLGLIGEIKEVIEYLQGKARQAFLKQFRDAAVAGEACYREVVEAPARVSVGSVGLSPYEWHVAIAELKSHPIVADLGLASESTPLAFELEMDITLGVGEVIK